MHKGQDFFQLNATLVGWLSYFQQLMRIDMYFLFPTSSPENQPTDRRNQSNFASRFPGSKEHVCAIACATGSRFSKHIATSIGSTALRSSGIIVVSGRVCIVNTFVLVALSFSPTSPNDDTNLSTVIQMSAADAANNTISSAIGRSNNIRRPSSRKSRLCNRLISTIPM